MTDGIAFVGGDNVVYNATPAFYQITGRTECEGLYSEQEIGDFFEGVITKEEMNRVLTSVREDGHWSGEFSLDRPDGAPITENLSVTRTTSEGSADQSIEGGSKWCDDESSMVVFSIMDVTEWWLAEESLKTIYGRLEDTIEFIPDPTFAVDKNRCVIVVALEYRRSILGMIRYLQQNSKREVVFGLLTPS
jgi:PAS domain-containing protein